MVQSIRYSLGVSSHLTGVYDPKAFILHAALLRQAFAHCAKFPTAASRRSLDRVSVPVWPYHPLRPATDRRLGGPLPHQLANQARAPPRATWQPLIPVPCDSGMLCGISPAFEMLFPTRGQITHVLLTRLPLYSRIAPAFSFDLHVLGTPPAFVLSQDQTLQLDSKSP